MTTLILFHFSCRFGLCAEPCPDQFQLKPTDVTMVSSSSKTKSIIESSTNIMTLKCKNTSSTNSGQESVKNNMDFTSEKCDVAAYEKQKQ